MKTTNNIPVRGCEKSLLEISPKISATATTARIRLLEFLTMFGFGGTERQVTNLTRMLDQKRFDIRYACMHRWGQFLDDIEKQQIPITEYRINSLYKPATFVQQLRFASDLRRQGIQISHSYNFYANVFAVPAARLAGVPVVIASIRDTGMGSVTPAKLLAHRWACGFADCILVNAEAIRIWLVGQGYRADKIKIIRNGIDLTRFSTPLQNGSLRQEFMLPESAPLVVVLARLVPHKGIEYFLEAAAVVKRRCPEVRFLVVGDIFAASKRDGTFERDTEYREKLRQQADRLGLGEHLLFTGYRSDIPELLSQAAVSVLPSIGGEGLPNALLESMAAGVPVVATRVGGSSEVIENEGIEGLLVPPRDPGEMARAICAVLTDSELARGLGRAAKHRVVENFSLQRMVSETENIYTALLDQARRKNRKSIAQPEREE